MTMTTQLQKIGAALTLSFCTLTAVAADATEKRHGLKVRESVEVSDHFIFNTDQIVNGSTILVRDSRHRVITATVTSRALQPNNAYSLWWAVFNYPEYCIEPYRCSVLDLEINGGDPQIKASVFWAGGFIADASGTANTALQLTRGRTDRELFAASGDYGLQNFADAELHLVLRSHGEAGVWGTVAQQIGTANEACPPQGCQNVFASFHPPRN